jgi:ATP-dependent Clp protease adaptor protein ClpS
MANCATTFFNSTTIVPVTLNGNQTQWQQETDVLVEEAIDRGYSLVLWNDDVNTFDHVATTLVEVCGHSWEQAEQCALLIHNNGKYAVQHGDYNDLKDKCLQICDRLINATVEER